MTIIHRNALEELGLLVHLLPLDFWLYWVNYLPIHTHTQRDSHTPTFSCKKSPPAVRSSMTDCRQQLGTDHEKLSVCMRSVHIWNAQRENKAQHQPRLQATNFSEIISRFYFQSFLCRLFIAEKRDLFQVEIRTFLFSRKTYSICSALSPFEDGRHAFKWE